MQQCLKAPRRTARARIVAPELLEQFLIAMHHANAAFDMGFGWESLAAFTSDLERMRVLQVQRFSSWSCLPIQISRFKSQAERSSLQRLRRTRAFEMRELAYEKV
jgi:hypothetical protein